MDLVILLVPPVDPIWSPASANNKHICPIN